MLVQQSLTTMSGLTIPVLAPPIAAETGLSPSLVGLYTAFLYGGSMISALVGGGFAEIWRATDQPDLSPCGSNRPTFKHTGADITIRDRSRHNRYRRGTVNAREFTNFSALR